MKKVYFIITLFTLVSCEKIKDCFQSEGDLVQIEVTGLDTFDRILVNRGIEMIIKEGPIQSVSIVSGDNLIDDVSAVVSGGVLVLTDDNTCNYTRDYNVTRITVTTPNITEIRSSTQFAIRSEGVLNFNDLELISEDTQGDFFNVGDFYMDINANNLTIINNNHSNYFLNGTANFLRVSFVSGGGRFEGVNMIAQDINVFHRGYNDVFLNPQNSIVGEIRSTGDVISVTQPPTVDVQEFYTGRLIFQ